MDKINISYKYTLRNLNPQHDSIIAFLYRHSGIILTAIRILQTKVQTGIYQDPSINIKGIIRLQGLGLLRH